MTAEDNIETATVIEWKKAGFESKETITRKTDLVKSVEYEAKNKNGLHNSMSKVSDLPKGINKIRKKIKDAYDEDDEDENGFFDNMLGMHNSLFNALHENEKKSLKVQENTHNIGMQQDASRLESMMNVNKIAKDIGLKSIGKEAMASIQKDLPKNSKDSIKLVTKEVIKQAGLEKTGIKKLSDKDLLLTYRGIKRVQKVGGNKAVEGMKLKEIMGVGEEKADDKKIAEVILQKSGRKNCKKDRIVKKNVLTNTKGKVKNLEQEISSYR